MRIIVKKLLLFPLLFTLGLAAETLHEWSFKDGTSGVVCPKQVAMKVDPQGKTPEGAPVLALKLLERPEEGPAHSVQVNFRTEAELIPGNRYRVTFQLRADCKGLVSASCILQDKPWSPLGKTSYWRGAVNEDWQPIRIEFTADKEGKTAVRAPMLMLGNFPVGGTLWVGPVRFEKLESFLPLALNPEWKVRFETTGAEKTVTLKDDAVDLLALAGKAKEKDAALLVNEFDSPEAGMMQVGCAADWWFEFSVNGKVAYDTLAAGNVESTLRPTNHVFNFPVQKGKNRIEVRVLSGSKGWQFVCGKVPFREKLNRITEIIRGAEWRPVKMDAVEWEHITPKRIDQLKIVPGTALDLSTQLPPYDIDKLGRLKTGKSGHMVAEKAPGEAIRLRGFNFTPASWELNFYKMTHAEMEELAEQIRLRGMNVVRMHFLDKALCSLAGLPKQGKERLKLSEVKLGATPEELPIDLAFLDRYDWFVKCLRERGIYLFVDIVSNNAGWTNASMQPAMRENFRYGLFISDQYRKNWRAGFDFLMNRVNPYTKTRMKDDPQFAAITFFNEQEHLFSSKGQAFEAFTPEWQTFRPGAPAFTEELLRADSPDGDAARKFLLAEIDAMNKFYLDATREAGYRGFVTLWDMFMRNLEGIAREPMTAVAMHTYHAHPNPAKLAPANYRQRLHYGSWFRNTMSTTSQRSSIDWDNQYFGRAAATRNFGKPFLLTEYSHSPYNRFVQESGPLTGAIAALQGWDALTPHANLVLLYHRPLRSGFDEAPGPMGALSSLFTAFLWQRGDVAEAKHAVNFRIPEAQYLSPRLLDAVGSGYNGLYLLTRIGSSYGDRTPAATLNLTPERFSAARSHGMYVTLENEAEVQKDILRSLTGELKTKGILPPGNRTDVNAGIFQSETGEITADTRNHTLTVITPRSEAAVLKKSEPVKLGALEIQSASGPCTVAAISLDGRRSLRESNRLLLIYGTMAVAENAVFSTENFDAEIDIGRMQLLIQSGKFQVTLATDRKNQPEVYALNLNGTRERQLPVTLADGKLTIAVDTSKLEFGTPYFEIVY